MVQISQYYVTPLGVVKLQPEEVGNVVFARGAAPSACALRERRVRFSRPQGGRVANRRAHPQGKAVQRLRLPVQVDFPYLT